MIILANTAPVVSIYPLKSEHISPFQYFLRLPCYATIHDHSSDSALCISHGPPAAVGVDDAAHIPAIERMSSRLALVHVPCCVRGIS
jgi:hypothetical protein